MEKFNNIKNTIINFIKSLKTKDYIFIAIYIIICALSFIFLSIKKGLIISAFLLVLIIVGGLIVKKLKKKGLNNKSILKRILIIILAFAIFLVIALMGFFIYIALTTEDFDPQRLSSVESTIVYDKNGNIMTTLSTKKRERISYDEMPEVLIDALIATEDSRFFQHNGFDFPRFFVASVKQLLGQSDAGGASTITMQVSKNNLTSSKSEGLDGIIRKFQDIYLAIFQIEKKYTKKEIIEFYLNDSLLGGSNYGVEQASQYYFGKSAKDLTLAEASLIVGLYKSPNGYNPYKNPEKATSRRKVVLNLMVRHGYITEEEANIANSIPIESLLTSNKDSDESEYQGYIDTVIDEVIEKTGYDPYIVSMKIYTTMDRDIQDNLNKIAKGETYTWHNDDVQTGVAVVDVNDGSIAGLISSRNTNEARSFNLATMVKNQPGSTAKPIFDYGPGIEYNNWSTYRLFVDEEWAYSNGKSIKNWDGKFLGIMTMKDALAASRNIPALKAFQSLDNKNILDFVTSLGITPEVEGDKIHEAHAIGGFNGVSPLQLASAYAAFANGGYYTKPYTVSKIEFREINKEEVFKSTKTRVMSEETAYMITNILEYAIDNGNIGGITKSSNVIAAKTGTSNFDEETKKKLGSKAYARDLWTSMYTPQYSATLWYGYKTINKEKEWYLTSTDNNQYKKALTTAVSKAIPATKEEFKVPSGIIKVDVEKYTWPAALISPYTPSSLITSEIYKVGTEPTEQSKRFSKLDSITNIQSSYDESTNKIKISWNYTTPKFIDETFLSSYFNNEIYGTSKEKYYQERLEYNRSNIGTIQYKIYKKDSIGDLKLLKTTTEKEYTYNVTDTNTNEVKLCIKAEYTIFKDNASECKEISTTIKKIDEPIPSELTINLNGPSTVNIQLNESYTDKTPPYNVYLNNEDITDATSYSTIVRKGTVTTSVTPTNTIKDIIKTNAVGTWTIEYQITYNGNQYTKSRKVNVVEKNN